MPYTLVQKPYPTFGICSFPYLERRTLHYTLMAINASQFLRKSDHVIFSFYYHVHGRLRPTYKDFFFIKRMQQLNKEFMKWSRGYIVMMCGINSFVSPNSFVLKSLL